MAYNRDIVLMGPRAPAMLFLKIYPPPLLLLDEFMQHRLSQRQNQQLHPPEAHRLDGPAG